MRKMPNKTETETISIEQLGYLMGHAIYQTQDNKMSINEAYDIALYYVSSRSLDGKKFKKWIQTNNKKGV